MRDSQHGGQNDHGTDSVAALARTVVSRLLTRGALPAPVPAVVTAVMQASLSSELDALNRLRPELRRARISDLDLVDVYFPEVARKLGADWAVDRLSWAEVTIGVARMQAVLHEIGRGWAANTSATQASPTVLLLLPAGEQHSFGAMVLMGMLRRRGVSVQLRFGAKASEMRKLVRENAFDCAMISVACEEKLGQCREVVKALKTGSGGRLRVVVGGPVLDRTLDVLQLTGADLATSDVDLALADISVPAALPEQMIG